MPVETTVVILFAVASAVAVFTRRLSIPYTVALVLAGLLLGSMKLLPAAHLTKDLLYAVFLPGLLFEAAFHLDFQQFRESKVVIHALAVPGVFLAIAATSVLLVLVAPVIPAGSSLPWAPAMVFAALITATDPIAVVSLFKSLGAPRRLAVIMEGESLLNDGTSVVLYMLAVAFVAGGTITVAHAAVDFVRVVGLGLMVGGAVGFGASKAVGRIDDPLIEITVTTVAAYGSFIAAEQMHGSGVLATVAAGMVCGNYGAPRGMSASTRLAVESFWEYVAFALNSIVFLLIGLEVDVDRLFRSWESVAIAYVVVTLARAAVVALTTSILRPTRERLPWSWAFVLTWGGLRGALSMVLVLALPSGFPMRDELVTMTFGVVILSILINGLTVGPLLRRLGLADATSDREAYEAGRGQLLASKAALESLEQLRREADLPEEIIEEIRTEYEGRATRATAAVADLRANISLLRREATTAARRQLLQVEKDELQALRRRGLIGEKVSERLLKDVDARLLDLRDRSPGATEPIQTSGVAAPTPARTREQRDE